MRRVLVVLLSIVVGLLGLLAFLVSRSGLTSQQVYREAAKAILTLIVALLITGILSFVLAQRAARQARDEAERAAQRARDEAERAAQQARDDDEARVLIGALQELKAGYERIQVARFHLSAQPTASALLKHISAISEARSQLHRVQRERFVLDTDVDNAVQLMLNYLTELANEYKANYQWITESALTEERFRKQVVEGSREHLGPVGVLDPARFELFTEFMDDARWRGGEFHRAYRQAKGLLQQWLDRLLMWTPQRPRAEHRESSA